jgi:uncharacterized delta-60 repeat protein
MKKTLNRPLLKTLYIAFSIFFLTLALSCIRTNAQLDPKFGTNGISTIAGPGSRFSMGLFGLPDGKLMVMASRSIGTYGNQPFDLIRLNADGSIDTSYGNGGAVELHIPFISTDGIFGIEKAAMQPDGKFVVVGTDNNDGLVLRFNPDGTSDTTFANGGVHRPNINNAGTDIATSVLIQPDGKILVGGRTNISADPSFFIRYNADGTLDSTFGSGGYSVPGITLSPRVLKMQSTGKYVAIVGFSDGGYLKRLNSDGSLDASFPVDNTTIYYSLAVQPDDKILVDIIVNRNESMGRTYFSPLIKRFNADGTIDGSFGTGGSLTFYWARYGGGRIQGITPLPNGQILLTGLTQIAPNRSKYRGIMGGAAVLSPTGTVTGKFILAGFPQMAGGNHAVILPDGKFVFGGMFATSNTSLPYSLHFARVTGVPTESYSFKENPFDWSRDAIADPWVFRPGNSNWYGFGGFPYGSTDDIRVPADYLSTDTFQDEFSAEIAYFRPSEGNWYIAPANTINPVNSTVIHWGQNGDIPAPADYDGDAKADLAVFRPSTGDWYIRNSNDNSFTALHWGLAGDKPAPGDYDGDGLSDIAVFRPSNGDWYILKSSGGMLFLHFGANGDIPVQEDYDGDGKADISVYRPSDGAWYRLNSSDGSFYALNWGSSTDIPVPADYDGDFKTDISVWRPSEGRWYIFRSSDSSMSVIYWGQGTDIPIPARH